MSADVTAKAYLACTNKGGNTMSSETTKDPGGERPEALKTFEAAARSGGVKPREQGLTATPETAPVPDSSERKAKTATKVLQAGVADDPKAATEAVQESPDPRIPG
jgi:hypothetical protein